jgi:hypothetical protein
MKSGPIHRLRLAIKRTYWNDVVRKVNYHAYLRHHVDSAYDADELDWDLNEQLAVIETRIWINRGNKVHAGVSDVPRTDPDKKSPWNESPYGNYIDWQTLRRFKKLVVDYEYERNRRRREWITAIGVIVAALGALANLYLTLRGKKP